MNERQILNRYSGKSWADVDLIGIDLETTGLSPWADEITEVAVFVGRHTDNGIDCPLSFSSLCNVTRPIPPRIEELTGIYTSFLQTCPDFVEVWANKIDPLTTGKVFPLWVAHNAEFEANFLSHHLPYGLWNSPYAWWLDTMILAKAADRETRRFAKGYKLMDLAERFEIQPRGPLHRAETDADLCLRVLQRLIQHGQWQTPVDALMAQRWWMDNAR